MKKTPLKRVRREPRAGRLKGKDLEALRRTCFERDGYKCVDCGRSVIWERDYPNSGHMAHRRNKRMWGDNLDNVDTKCSFCHGVIEHTYGPSGVKPCPPKPAKVTLEETEATAV